MALAWLAACHRDATSARDRLLAQLPAEASAVFVADGAALRGARIRPIVDALRTRWPATLACVIDAGLAADEVGIATTAQGTSIVIVEAHATVHRTCKPLSNLAPGIVTATIGSGVAIADPAASVLGAPHYARARGYLRTAPIAAALESARFHTTVIATAQPAPLEAWIAFDADATFAPELELGLHALVERMLHDSTTSHLAARVQIARAGPQVIARVTGTIDGDLAAAAQTLLDWGWGGRATASTDAAWRCPRPVSTPVTGCAPGKLSVTSLRAVADAIDRVPLRPVVENGLVTGLRLGSDLEPLGLQRGDLVFACEGRRLETQAQLVAQIRTGPHAASITVRRDGVDTEVVFDERTE